MMATRVYSICYTRKRPKTKMVYLQFTQKIGFLTLFTKEIKNHEIEKCMRVVFKKNRTEFLFLQQAYNFLYGNLHKNKKFKVCGGVKEGDLREAFEKLSRSPAPSLTGASTAVIP